jgi:hypothetical protein
MSKKEKFLWILAYTATAILTLLPFFQVGLTSGDDFQYYNMAQNTWEQWEMDAENYAHDAGRFYFLVTKYFYYIPYVIDSFAWTKFVQYASLLLCYVLFAYTANRIFRSRRLGALTLLLLIFNTVIGLEWHYPPTAYPFYFSFSLIIYLWGILLYVGYTEKNGYWRVLASALLFFIACVFYEDYLVFTVIFACCIIIRNWRIFGFRPMLTSKSFYKEILPYIFIALAYMACYFSYRSYLSNVLKQSYIYSGTVIAHPVNVTNFFKILYQCTLYNLPCRNYWLGSIRGVMIDNSPLISGHYNNLFFILTHAPVVAYINALIQCLILWMICYKADLKKISWKAIISGIIIALIVAFSAHILIAITEKYNYDWAEWMQAYVTSFYSYFSIMLVLALLIFAVLKLCSWQPLRQIACAVLCISLFTTSVLSYYINDLVSKEWHKSQNRITTLQLIAEKGFPDHITEDAIIYDEQLHNTSFYGHSICVGTQDFEQLIQRLVHRQYKFAFNQEQLISDIHQFPENPIYFIQATESKKGGELLMVFSHISQMDSCNILNAKADNADIYYYSPTKDFTLYYDLYAKTDSARTKAITILSANKHEKLTHLNIQEPGMNPLGFCISNMLIPTTDTLWLP